MALRESLVKRDVKPCIQNSGETSEIRIWFCEQKGEVTYSEPSNKDDQSVLHVTYGPDVIDLIVGRLQGLY